MVSTMDLSGLAPPEELRRSMRAAAMLCAVLCEEPGFRCFDFDPVWGGEGEEAGMAWGHYDNGSGDHVHVLVGEDRGCILGFDHESEVSPYTREDHGLWPGMLDGLPAPYHRMLDGPELMREDATFCVWWSDGEWDCGAVAFADGEDDGSSYLLGLVAMGAAEFAGWARDYFECEVPDSIVAAAFAGEALDRAGIQVLNPKRNVDQALAELAAM